MTVAELIEFLKTQPQDLQVAYRIYSEQCLLERDDISLFVGCEPREDGWVQYQRRDMPTRMYLLLPGN